MELQVPLDFLRPGAALVVTQIAVPRALVEGPPGWSR